LFNDIISPFPVIFEFYLKEVGEKEEFEYGEHNKQLDEYDHPEFPADIHTFESVQIEIKDFFQHWLHT
jgi:hypothetical protein